MNNWSILGIEKTSDKDKIKEAYLNRLTNVHPEVNPEGFKDLRRAYEEILNEIKNSEEIKESLTPIEIWINKVMVVYSNFASRINIELWNKLLDDEICIAIDSKEEAKNSLLRYIMENYYIPNKIYKVIDKKFSILESKDELYENYPRDFIDFFISKIKYDDIINFDLFKIEENRDYDRWIYLYGQIRACLLRKEYEGIEKLLSELKELDIIHPYSATIEIRYLLAIDNKERAKEVGNEIYEEYRDDLEVLKIMGEIEWVNENYNGAIKYYNEILDIDPENYDGRYCVADCKFKLGYLKEAKDIYMDLLKINIYDNYIRDMVYNLNIQYIEELKEKLKDNPMDIETIITMDYCYYENYNEKEGLEAIKVDIDIPDEKAYEYYDLLGKLLSRIERAEEAIEAFSVRIEPLKNEIDRLIDKDIKDEKLRDLAYLYFQIGREKYFLKEYEEALEKYRMAISTRERHYHYSYMAEALLKLGRYEEAVEACSKSLDIEEEQAEAHLVRGKIYYEMGYYNEALEDSYKAINIYPYFSEPYSIIAKVYCAYREYDDCLEIIERAEENKISNSEFNLFKIMALRGKKEYKEVLNIFKTLNKEISNNELVDRELISKLYYEESLVYEEISQFDLSLKYVELAISANKNNIRLCYQRAFLLNKLERNEEAIEEYNHILELNPEDDVVYGLISEIYEAMEDSINQLIYLNKQIEVNPSEYYLISRGIYFYDRNDFKRSEKDYIEALKLEPESKYAFNNLGCIYLSTEKYQKAVECFKKAIEFNNDRDYLNPYSNLTKAYIKMKEYNLGIEVFEELINLDEDNLFLYVRRGKLYKKMRKYSEAIEDYKYFIRLAVEDKYYDDKVNAVYQLGELYELTWDLKKAIDQYEILMELDNNNEQGYRNIAKINLYLENYEEAYKYVEKQIKISPKDWEIYLLKGDILKAMGNVKKANKIYDKAFMVLAAAGEDPACKKCAQGKLCFAKNKLNKSHSALINAIEISRKNPACDHEECFEAYYYLGKIYELNEDYEKALDMYNKSNEFKGEEDIDSVKAIRRIQSIE